MYMYFVFVYLKIYVYIFITLFSVVFTITIIMYFIQVIDITEIKYIKELPMLRHLNLLRNPIQELPDYRLSILFQIQRLTELDRHKVEVEEKVASVNMFNPPPEVIASRDHIMHVVYSFLQPSRVWDRQVLWPTVNSHPSLKYCLEIVYMDYMYLSHRKKKLKQLYMQKILHASNMYSICLSL